MITIKVNKTKPTVVYYNLKQGTMCGENMCKIKQYCVEMENGLHEEKKIVIKTYEKNHSVHCLEYIAQRFHEVF